MTREEVERLMRESGMSFHLGMPHEAVIQQMTRFASMLRDEMLEAAEHAIGCAMDFEREECAKVCEQQLERPSGYQGTWEGYGRFKTEMTGKECATAIRARGEK